MIYKVITLYFLNPTLCDNFKNLCFFSSRLHVCVVVLKHEQLAEVFPSVMALSTLSTCYCISSGEELVKVT